MLPFDAYKFYKLNKDLKSDITFSFLSKANLINALSQIFRPNYKIILSERTNLSAYFKMMPKWKSIFQRLMVKNIFPLADIINSNSNHAIKDLKENFGLKNANSVIYNPIEKFNSENNNDLNFEICSDFFNVVCVANFREEKDHISLLNAVHKLEKGKMKFHLIGQGDDSILKKMSIELGIENEIVFWGYQKTPQIILSKCSCSILTSKFEGFPNTVLESIECQIPAIASNTEGAAELLNPSRVEATNFLDFKIAEYGLLVEIGNPSSIANALLYMKDNIDFQNELKNRYSNYRKTFYTENIISQYSTLINQC